MERIKPNTPMFGHSLSRYPVQAAQDPTLGTPVRLVAGQGQVSQAYGSREQHRDALIHINQLVGQGRLFSRKIRPACSYPCEGDYSLSKDCSKPIPVIPVRAGIRMRLSPDISLGLSPAGEPYPYLDDVGSDIAVWQNNHLDSLYRSITIGFRGEDGRYISGYTSDSSTTPGRDQHQDTLIGREVVIPGYRAEDHRCVILSLPLSLQQLCSQLESKFRLERELAIPELPLVFYQPLGGAIRETVFLSQLDITPQSLPELQHTIDNIRRFTLYSGSANLEQLLSWLPPSRLLQYLRAPTSSIAQAVAALFAPCRDELRQAVEQADLAQVKFYQGLGAKLTALYDTPSDDLANLLQLLLKAPTVQRWAVDSHRKNPTVLAEQTQLGQFLYDHGCRVPINDDLIRSLPSLAAYMIVQGERCQGLNDMEEIFKILAMDIANRVISQDEFATLVEGIKRACVHRADWFADCYLGCIRRMLSIKACNVVTGIPNIYRPGAFASRSAVEMVQTTVAAFAPYGIFIATDQLRQELKEAGRWECSILESLKQSCLSHMRKLFDQIKPTAERPSGRATSSQLLSQSVKEYEELRSWPRESRPQVEALLQWSRSHHDYRHHSEFRLALMSLVPVTTPRSPAGFSSTELPEGHTYQQNRPPRDWPLFEFEPRNRGNAFDHRFSSPPASGKKDIHDLLKELASKIEHTLNGVKVFDDTVADTHQVAHDIARHIVCDNIDGAQAQIEQFYGRSLSHVEEKLQMVETFYQQLDQLQSLAECQRARAEFVSSKGVNQESVGKPEPQISPVWEQAESFGWLRDLFQFTPDTTGKRYRELAQLAIDHYYRMPSPNQVASLATGGPPSPDLDLPLGADSIVQVTRNQIVAEALLVLLANHDQPINTLLTEHPQLLDLIPLAMVYQGISRVQTGQDSRATELFNRDMQRAGYGAEEIAWVVSALGSQNREGVELLMPLDPRWDQPKPIVARLIRLAGGLADVRVSSVPEQGQQSQTSLLLDGEVPLMVISVDCARDINALVGGGNDLACVTGGALTGVANENDSYLQRQRLRVDHRDKQKWRVALSGNARDCVILSLDDNVRRAVADMAGITTCDQDHSEENLRHYSGQLPCVAEYHNRHGDPVDCLMRVHNELELRQIPVPESMTITQKLMFARRGTACLSQAGQREIRQQVERLKQYGLRPLLGPLSQNLLTKPKVLRQLRETYQLEPVLVQGFYRHWGCSHSDDYMITRPTADCRLVDRPDGGEIVKQ